MRTFNSWPVLTALVVILALAISACGYGFRHQRSNLPPEIKTIAIPMFENKTNELRLEGLVTEQVRFQFSNSQILKLVPVAEADVILKGTVNSVSTDDVALTSQSRSEFRRISISISARLVRSDTGEVLYQGGASQWRSYTINAGENLASEAARRDALRLVARDAAQIIHDGALQNF